MLSRKTKSRLADGWGRGSITVSGEIGFISYEGPSDPMMRRYIEFQHYAEIEDLSPAEATKDWRKEYQRLQGQTNNLVGKLAESYVGAVMRGFDGREVSGAVYFNHSTPVILPAFETIERRGGVVKEGISIEIDLTGEWTLPDGKGQGAWLVQVRIDVPQDVS